MTNGSDAMKADIVSKYTGIFKGVGRLHDHKVKFHIDETVTPVCEPRRPIPYHLQGKFRKALTDMEDQGLIEEHHGPAPWVSNPVLAPKKR